MQIETPANETISNVIWHANFTDQFLLCSWERGVFIPLLFLSLIINIMKKQILIFVV